MNTSCHKRTLITVKDVQQKLQAPDCRCDLVVCDEAHKMSATVFGGETKYTKRYRLGQLLSTLTRHFLLMTATPHNGKEADFQLFMALLDGDRFESRYRDGVHTANVSDLMRRMVKESLLKFDGTPLFTVAGLANPAVNANHVAEPGASYKVQPIAPHKPSPHQKLVIFTEHRDTLNYLQQRISTLLGRNESVVLIHGGIGREERLKVQESFKHDPRVQVLLATDAAGEGINLQRAYLMVNYDLPWNPNRIEQRFGRIHRIGQTEVCHLWNLVAEETREGDVYRKLLEKLELARQALGGQVFDVLGRIQFAGKSLRELLIEAIRYGEQPDVQAFLSTVLDAALDRDHLQTLLDDHVLAPDAMDASKVQRIRADMERADARRLQPHYIESFFHEAFKRLGGSEKQREPRRFEVTHVPALVRNRDRMLGIGEPVLPRYERIAFEKSLVAPQGEVLAAFVCPGQALPDAVIDLTLERNRDLLKRGTVLVDERDMRSTPRVLFYLEHAIQDVGINRAGERRVVSKLKLEAQLSPLPPVVLGGALIIPMGLIQSITGHATPMSVAPVDTQISAARARAVIMATERSLGFVPVNREFEKLGYDIESSLPGSGKLRFIEVKGRVAGAATITVTHNEILYSLNKPDDFILGIVEFLDESHHQVHYLRQPFQREPDFGVTSVNYDFAELLARAEAPR